MRFGGEEDSFKDVVPVRGPQPPGRIRRLVACSRPCGTCFADLPAEAEGYASGEHPPSAYGRPGKWSACSR